jgi:predicted AlkP superfamily pyrophosphatase or phosphodiesterase
MTPEDLKPDPKAPNAWRIPARDRERTGNRFLRTFLASLALLWITFWGPLAGLASEPIVILISWDGTRHDYPERTRLPALERLERDGVRTQLVPVFPTNTFPNHVSLATGAYPARHGIVGNSFLDRVRGVFRRASDASWLDAEPLWITAERQGVRAAVFFWVGSESDWNGSGATYRKSPFDSGVPESEKVAQILTWLDLPDVVKQLGQQDRELGRLLEGLDRRKAWQTVTLIVTSDHGMAFADRDLDVLTPLKERGISARIFPGGGMAYLWLDDPRRRDEALAVLEALENVRSYASERLPTRLKGYHPRRSGDIIVITEPPYRFRRSSLLDRVVGLSGMHGYTPDHSEMAAIFYAMGRGVPRDLCLETVRAIDVAPTVSRLLAIEPPRHSQGQPILSGGAGP